MSEFTYETNDTSRKLETFEWDNVWWEQTANKTAKRIAYIGDSISCGTRRLITSLSKSEILCDGFGTSKALDNPYFKGADLIMLDNRVENKTVTERYNDFLDGIDDDRWIVLCHEDWELKENLLDVLEKLDKDKLYGPIGVFIEEKKNVDVLVMKGRVEQSPKNGGKTIIIRGKDSTGWVDTFDCQCLIFHSSLASQ